MTLIPGCSSFCFALRNDSAIGPWKQLHQLSSDVATVKLGEMAHLGEVDAKGIHVQSVKEAREALAETSQTLVHELEVHHVGFKVGYSVGQFGEGGLECVEGKGFMAIDASLGGFAEGGSGRRAEGRRGTRSRIGARSSCAVVAFTRRHGCSLVVETWRDEIVRV